MYKLRTTKAKKLSLWTKIIRKLNGNRPSLDKRLLEHNLWVYESLNIPTEDFSRYAKVLPNSFDLMESWHKSIIANIALSKSDISKILVVPQERNSNVLDLLTNKFPEAQFSMTANEFQKNLDSIEKYPEIKKIRLTESSIYNKGGGEYSLVWLESDRHNSRYVIDILNAIYSLTVNGLLLVSDVREPKIQKYPKNFQEVAFTILNALSSLGLIETYLLAKRVNSGQHTVKYISISIKRKHSPPLL